MRARDNPFRVERLHALSYRLPPALSWEGLLARLAAQGHRGALLGPEGHGKTLLLDELGRRLAERGLRVRRGKLDSRQRRLRPEQSVALLQDVGAGDLLLLDSADQLGRLAWLRFCRATRGAGGVLVTSHRQALLPPLVTCETSPELLLALVRELHPPTAEALAPEIEAFYRRHHGNLRCALRELYDLCAGAHGGPGGV